MLEYHIAIIRMERCLSEAVDNNHEDLIPKMLAGLMWAYEYMGIED